MTATRRDLGHPREIVDLDWSEPVGVCAVAQLAIPIATPSPHGAIIPERQAEIVTRGDSGHLGIGSLDDHQDAPVKVHTLSFHARLVAISAGNQHSMALEEGSGQVWVWGGNGQGELGDGGSHPYVWLPIEVAFVDGIVAIAAGASHSMALKKDGTVRTWGYNEFGQLGDGTTTTSVKPVEVLGLNGVLSFAAGQGHSMALKKDGTVWTWGSNEWGTLGDGTTTNRLIPVQVAGIRRAAATAGGYLHSLAAAPADK